MIIAFAIKPTEIKSCPENPLIKHNHSTIQEVKMKNTKTVKEAYIFLGLTLAFSYFVFWGPLALFKVPALVL